MTVKCRNFLIIFFHKTTLTWKLHIILCSNCRYQCFDSVRAWCIVLFNWAFEFLIFYEPFKILRLPHRDSTNKSFALFIWIWLVELLLLEHRLILKLPSVKQICFNHFPLDTFLPVFISHLQSNEVLYHFKGEQHFFSFEVKYFLDFEWMHPVSIPPKNPHLLTFIHWILYAGTLPSITNPFVTNVDFVLRGTHDHLVQLCDNLKKSMRVMTSQVNYSQSIQINHSHSQHCHQLHSNQSGDEMGI